MTPSTTAATRELTSTPATVQPGVFDGSAASVATVRSGEAFAVRTLTRTPLGLDTYERLGPDMVAIEAAGGAWLGPHPVLGPITVEGHPLGCTLQVDLLEIAPDAPTGWNGVREGYGVPGLEGAYDIELIDVDADEGVLSLRSGIVLPLRPFFGVLAVRPDPALGTLGTIPPGPFGGNIDCRELVAGSRLFLPTFTEGAGFLIGDGHGTQGDGEITETALEMSMRGVVRLTSRPELDTDRPLAATVDATVFFGFGDTFDAAARDVIAHAASRVAEWSHLTEHDAYRLFSLACDVRVTQLVNGVVGAHLIVPRHVTEQLAGWPGWLHL
ncbi:acetamidase/formamidase family protein [Dermatobacter hominis]|uniref:acetamidase/formamidase family protein n=1 Tax=Dermatobacter hominis TaxID=2884263 RepID=UPI001D109F43|nr:acetamidase/formamidase family protein [Dermatobacter hominis]UDY35457.1 acetamidase/formamidase family protein [Dermatobacter hominis]